jgi:hypothetical protein
LKPIIKTRLLAGVITTTALILGGVGLAVPANAAGPMPLGAVTSLVSDDSYSPTPVSSAAVQNFVTRTQEETSGWVALGGPELAALRASFQLEHYTPSSGYQYLLGNSVGWRVSDSTSVLQIPVSSGQGAEAQSAITVQFDGRGRVEAVIETALQAVSANSGTVAVWRDSHLVLSRLVTVATADSALTSPTESVVTKAGPYVSSAKKGNWWAELNSCLSSEGIASWVVAGISIICAAACVITLGIACAICIAAAAGTATTAVSICIRYANNHS